MIAPWDWPKGRSYEEQEKSFPEQVKLFDLVEFLYEHAALPKAIATIIFSKHDHLSYYPSEGRAKFAAEINRLLERRGLAFELVNGEVTRLAPTGLQEALANAVFRTGDSHLDNLLETAREKLLNKSFKVGQEGFEKLWDA